MGLRGAVPEEIWLASSSERIRQWTKRISERYEKRFSKAIEVLEDSLSSYVFPALGTRKIFSTNMLE
jgi:transposase-like protein